uniref:response regulator n=1 Tax=Oceanobacillus massiliensis TaxID=1465765 RepID=UPI00301688C9
MEQVRVIVIDDSAFMRKMIADILESDSRIKVIATARNGADGIDKIKKLSPDVVTLDVHMPVMDGM